MSRSEIYTKFHFSVLNNSCLIHITIENCVKSREKMIYSSFYQEKLINYVFVNFMVSVSSHINYSQVCIVMEIYFCYWKEWGLPIRGFYMTRDQHEKFEQRRLRKITTSLLQTNILLLIPVYPQKQQYCDLSKFILWKKRAMIDNSLELLKSDHATLINFKPISSHFLKIIFNIAISQSRWV